MNGPEYTLWIKTPPGPPDYQEWVRIYRATQSPTGISGKGEWDIRNGVLTYRFPDDGRVILSSMFTVLEQKP